MKRYERLLLSTDTDEVADIKDAAYGLSGQQRLIKSLMDDSVLGRDSASTTTSMRS